MHDIAMLNNKPKENRFKR